MTDVNVQAIWQKSIEEQTARVEAAWAELGKLETRGADQARTLLDEWTRLGRESLAYGADLQGAWRKASLDATKRALEMIAPK